MLTLNPLVTVPRASCKRGRAQSAEYLNGKCAQAYPDPRVRTLSSRGRNSGLAGPHFIPGPVRSREDTTGEIRPPAAAPKQPQAPSTQLDPRTRTPSMGFLVVCERVQLSASSCLFSITRQSSVKLRLVKESGAALPDDRLLSKGAIGEKYRPAALFNRNTLAEQNV